MLNRGTALHLPPAGTAQRRVEGEIGRALDQLAHAVSSQDVLAVVKKIRFGEPLDYDVEWQAFAMAYLLVNYRKMLAATRAIPLGATTVVADAGCGTGAASLALLTVLAETGAPAPDVIELVDRSPEQVDTARTLVLAAARSLGFSTRVSPVTSELTRYSVPDNTSVVLLSHVLGEQTGSGADLIVERLTSQLLPNGVLLAVEREDDCPWSSEIASGCDVAGGTFSAHAPAPLHPDDDRTWNTRWLLATRVPDWMPRLVHGYFACWRGQDVGRLATIFTDDATYHEKPFDQPLRGRDAIEEYWRQRVLPQQRPVAQPVEIRYGVLSATLEWRASFVLETATRDVRGLMHLSFDPHRQQIDALREVFRTP